MGLPITAAVTGAAISPLTSPSFGLSVDVPPNTNTLAYMVTGNSIAGGTAQVHTNATPWQLRISRPANIKTLRDITRNSSGVAIKIPANNYSVTQKRSMYCNAANTEIAAGLVTTTITVPAGADQYSFVILAEMLSLQIGVLTTKLNELKALCLTGVMS